MFAEAAASTRSFADDLEGRVAEQFGPAKAAEDTLLYHTKRPAWLVVAGRETDYTAEELLEVATSEQEEHYQFFLQEQDEVDDPWVRRLFRELSGHARRLVLYLEGEREGVVDRDGA